MSGSGQILNAAEVDFLLEGAGGDEPAPPQAPTGAEAPTVTMRGDLEQINLSDIFQTLAMAKMEGVLVVRNPLEERQVHCRDGVVRILVPGRLATRRLGQRLVQAGLLQPDQLRTALVAQRKEHLPLGQLLVKEGLVTAEQIDEIVGTQVAEDLFALFTWRHGTFEFYKGAVTDPALLERFATCPEYEVNSLLLEVARRADEWESILAAIGSLDEVPTHVAELPPEHDLGEVARVLYLGADGQTSYRSLAEQQTSGLFEVARAARDLVRQGLLQNVDDAGMLAAAAAAVAANHHKQALMLLQTLLDRPGDRELGTVVGAAGVLEQAGERRLAGQVLLEAAQLQTEAGAALDLARKARALAPHDPGTLSFLRTTLLAHSPAESPELEQCTLDLLDALYEADLCGTALEITADARATGTARPAILVREARLRQKSRDVPGAIAVLDELAAHYQAAGDRAHLIETYQSILRLDRTRKDVQKLLAQARQTRLGRALRVAAAVLSVGMLGAMGFVWWQQRSFAAAVAAANAEIGGLLERGDRQGARERLGHWQAQLGACEPVEDLQSRVDFADAAERTRLQRIARREVNELLTQAAAALAEGDLSSALQRYRQVWERSEFRAELAEVADTRLAAAILEIESAVKTLGNRLPPEPGRLVDRRELLRNLAELQGACRPGLQRLVAEFDQLHAAAAWPEFVSAAARERLAAALPAARPLFAQVRALAQAYTEALQRNDDQRRLDPLFKAAVAKEAAHDFAGALALYQQLERESTADAELRAHFRDQVARHATIARLLDAVRAATAAGDFPTAQKHYRALCLAFPELPFGELVELPLRIESQPPGAAVHCNDQPVGQTPLTLPYRPAASNRLALLLPGFRTEARTVTGDETGAWQTMLTLEPRAEQTLDALVEVAPARDADGTTYIVDRNGRVTAWPAGAAAPKWQFRSGDLSGLLTRPLRHGPHVLVGSLDGELRALRASDGELAFALADLPTELAPVLLGDQLALATPQGRLHLVDLASRQVTAADLGESATTALLAHGQAVLAVGGRGTVARFAVPSLERSWLTSLDGFVQPAATLADGVLLVADEHGHLAGLDAATGAVRWRRDLDGEALGAPAASGGTAWLATPEQLVRFEIGTGKRLGAIPRGSAPWAGPVVRFGERLGVPVQDGTVAVIDPARGEPLYRLDGHKRGVRLLVCGDELVLALADRRLLRFTTLR